MSTAMKVGMSPYRLETEQRERAFLASQTEVSAREFYFMKQLLLKHGSAAPNELVKPAFENLQRFLGGRLTYKPQTTNFYGLLRAPYTSFHQTIPPFQDHARFFLDRASGQLVWTSQPYFPTYGRDKENEAEEKAEREKFDFHPPFHPALVKEALTRMRQRSERFAQKMIEGGFAKRGLSVEVFGPEFSWYFPGRCALIVYREGKYSGSKQAEERR